MRPQVIALEQEDFGVVLRWVAAAVAACAAHVMVAGGYLLLRHTATDGAPQAPLVIVDLAPSPVAPASDLDIAPGPQMQESQAQAEPEPDPAPDPKPQEQPAPPEPPVHTATVATAEIKPQAQPKPEKPPAPRTTAAPRSPVHSATAPAAPAPGSSRAESLSPSWISRLFSHLLRYRQYPTAAQAARQEGVVMLSFTMDRQGRVLARHIVRSSGYSALDAEALAMIDRAQPLPPFPPEVTASTRSFVAPIRFSLR
jgi:protein TonB